MTRINKGDLRLLLSGLAAGDSLGSTSEFAGPDGVAAAYARHAAAGWPFRQVGGGPFGWRPGDPTDDTDMAMCIVRAAHAAGGRFDPQAVADGFVRWLEGGPRDVGGTTARTLARRRAGASWHDAGYQAFRSDPRNSANGSLMRNGVVAALSDNLSDAFRYTVQHAIVTHYDPLSVQCCAVQTHLLAGLLAARCPGGSPAPDPAGPWLGDALDAFARWVRDEPDPAVRLWHDRVTAGGIEAAACVLRAADFSEAFDPFDARWRSVGQGYSLLTLQIAAWAWRWVAAGEPYPRVPSHLPADPFRRTGAGVLGWVALVGRDSDTYGASAGPLVAATLGGLPASMTDGLRALAEFDAMGACSG